VGTEVSVWRLRPLGHCWRRELECAPDGANSVVAMRQVSKPALSSGPPRVQEVVRVPLPTPCGVFDAHAFECPTGHVYVALCRGGLDGSDEVLCRLHSECLTGDALTSLRCDCGQQLRFPLRTNRCRGVRRADLRDWARGPWHRTGEQAALVRRAGQRGRHGGRQRAPRPSGGRPGLRRCSGRPQDPWCALDPTAVQQPAQS
jgi:hypothetical protein